MAAALLRILSLFALVLMPLGMASAPAAADAPAVHHMAAATDHCDTEAPADKGMSKSAQCAMACSMMLAATPNVAQRVAVGPAALDQPQASQRTGLAPEMDPPPPKRS